MPLGLPRRPDVDPAAVLRRLDPTLAGARLRELGEGFVNVAWAVDERLLLRVSKEPEATERRRDADRDVALLRLVEEHVTLPSNRVVAADPDEGALLLTLVGGRTADDLPPRDPTRFGGTLARFVEDLWAVPTETARRVVGPDRPLTAWAEETWRDWDEAAPLLPAPTRRAVDAFRERPVPPEPAHPVFSHNDLQAAHLVVTDDGRDLSGVIDWSDAVLGDPARDLALVALDLGPDLLDLVLARLDPPPDPGLRERALWSAARAGVEGVAYRATRRRPSLGTARAALHRVLDVLE